MFGHDDQNDDSQTNVPVTNDDSTAVQQQDEMTLPAPTDDAPVQDMPSEDYVTTPIGMPLPSETPEVPAPTPDAVLSSTPIGIASNGSLSNLNELKQDALRELSPLIGYLDQSPEEKYNTAKMVYEETKDQNLLSSVYEAAKNLPDDKSKAQAIYEIVKLINESN